MNTRRLSQTTEPIPAHAPDDETSSAATDAALTLENRSPESSADDWAKSLAVIEAVANAKTRTNAVVALVKSAAGYFPNSNVRCGIGTTRLRRFYDSRLGWLTPASELFQHASESWDEDLSTVPTRPEYPGLTTSQRQPESSDRIRLNIDDEVGLGRCVLWVENGALTVNDRVWLRRTLPSLRAILWQRNASLINQFTRKTTASRMETRIYAWLVTFILILLSLWPVSYRVRCTTVVRPKLSRIVAAPFDATLEATHVQPGDAVKAGDVLLTLDGRPLRLELETIEAQIAQVAKEYDMAMVAGRVAESQQAKLRMRELNRQRELLVSRLRRLSVTSPIDGIIVHGDLNRSIGAPLETGQAVLEVAPLDQMIVELEIPEYEIGYVDNGTTARVRLTAANDEIQRPIDVVYPSAELRDDQNVFVAHLIVDNADGVLRPGMRGDAIVYGPVRPWLWSLARTGWEKTLWWIGY